jgi:transcriptional regulator with XRE-family HTH domain
MDTNIVRDGTANEALVSFLKLHLTAKGMNGSDLARKMKLTPAAVTRWLSGQTTPKAKYVPQLARMLGVSPMDLTRIIHQEKSNDSAPGTDHPGN